MWIQYESNVDVMNLTWGWYELNVDLQLISFRFGMNLVDLMWV